MCTQVGAGRELAGAAFPDRSAGVCHVRRPSRAIHQGMSPQSPVHAAYHDMMTANSARLGRCVVQDQCDNTHKVFFDLLAELIKFNPPLLRALDKTLAACNATKVFEQLVRTTPPTAAGRAGQGRAGPGSSIGEVGGKQECRAGQGSRRGQESGQQERAGEGRREGSFPSSCLAPRSVQTRLRLA